MLFWYQVFEALCSDFHPFGSNLDMAPPNPEHPRLCHEDLPTRASGAGKVGQLQLIMQTEPGKPRLEDRISSQQVTETTP